MTSTEHEAARDFLALTAPIVLRDLVVRCAATDPAPPEIQTNAGVGARIDHGFQNPFVLACDCLACLDVLVEEGGVCVSRIAADQIGRASWRCFS